jgi:hypothetical protein
MDELMLLEPIRKYLLCQYDMVAKYFRLSFMEEW